MTFSDASCQDFTPRVALFFFFIRGVLFLVSLEVLSLIKTLMATYCPLLECASPKLMRTFASSPFDVTYLG